MTLTFDLLTLKFERNRANPGWIIDNLANFCTRFKTLYSLRRTPLFLQCMTMAHLRQSKR